MLINGGMRHRRRGQRPPASPTPPPRPSRTPARPWPPRCGAWWAPAPAHGGDRRAAAGRHALARARNQRDEINALSVAFNDALLSSIVDLGQNVLYFDAAFFFSLMYGKPQNFELVNGKGRRLHHARRQHLHICRHRGLGRLQPLAVRRRPALRPARSAMMPTTEGAVQPMDALLFGGRLARHRARPRLAVGLAAEVPPRVRPVHQPAPGAPVRRRARARWPAASPATSTTRGAREHRGRIHQPRRRVRGHRARDRGPGIGRVRATAPSACCATPSTWRARPRKQLTWPPRATASPSACPGGTARADAVARTIRGDGGQAAHRHPVRALRAAARARFDVVVASNLFGDILSTWAPATPAPSAWRPRPTSTPSGASVACSSRCTARRPTSLASNIANPVAMIWSAALMLQFLGERPRTTPSRAPSSRCWPTARARPTWAAGFQARVADGAEPGRCCASWRVVPSTPASDSDCSNTAPCGWRLLQQRRQQRRRWRAPRATPGPEPLSSTGVARRPKRSRHQRFRSGCATRRSWRAVARRQRQEQLLRHHVVSTC